MAATSLTPARALARYNITVNSFAPGVMDIPLWGHLNIDKKALQVSKNPAGYKTSPRGFLRSRS